MDLAIAAARADLLDVRPKVRGGSPLPLAYFDRIEALPGVKQVSLLNGFSATYQNPTLLGAALGWAFFNGLSASPFGFTFQLAVTLQIVALGVAWALVIGLVAGLPPALRAARMSVTGALRAGY